MTNLPYSYASAALSNATPLPASAPQTAAVRTAQQYTQAAIDNLTQQFGALDSRTQHTMLETMRFNGIHGAQEVAAFLNRTLAAPDVLGNDAMLATATSQTMHTLNDVHSKQRENGYTTNLDPTQQAILRSQVENLVKSMGSADKSEKIRAARAITISPEAAAYAEQTVEEIEAPRNFALSGAELAAPLAIFAPVAAVATIESAAVGNSNLQNLLTGQIAKFDFSKDEELRRQSYRTQAGPVPSVAMQAVSTGNELLGDLPLQDLPKLPGGRGRGGPDFA